MSGEGIRRPSNDDDRRRQAAEAAVAAYFDLVARLIARSHQANQSLPRPGRPARERERRPKSPRT